MEETNKKAVEIFEKIRDIPYHIPFKNEEDDCCEGKNSRLADELSQLGYKVRPRIGLINWGDLPLTKDLTLVPHEEESSHYFLEVVPPGLTNWVQIDATWNKQLEKAGFPIAEWDGKSSTNLAISCYKILKPEENEEYLKSIDYEEDMSKNGKFYEAFNNYCDSFLKEE